MKNQLSNNIIVGRKGNSDSFIEMAIGIVIALLCYPIVKSAVTALLPNATASESGVLTLVPLLFLFGVIYYVVKRMRAK